RPTQFASPSAYLRQQPHMSPMDSVEISNRQGAAASRFGRVLLPVDGMNRHFIDLSRNGHGSQQRAVVHIGEAVTEIPIMPFQMLDQWPGPYRPQPKGVVKPSPAKGFPRAIGPFQNPIGV